MAKSADPKNPKEHIQQMNILYLGLIGGQIMMLVALWFGIGMNIGAEDTGSSRAVGETDPIVFIFAAIFFASTSMSFFLYNKKKVEGAALKGSLMEKLNHYRSSFILRAALLEGPNLMMLVAYFFIEPHILLLTLFAIGLMCFIFIQPTVRRISDDYQLSISEQSELRNSTL